MRKWPVAAGLIAFCACTAFSASDPPPPPGQDGGAGSDADATTPDAGGFDLGCNAPGLLAAWTFDEADGGTARDCTGHLFHASLRGDAGWAPGHDGGAALDLRGGDFAECANANLLHFVGPWTIAAWVLDRPTSRFGRILSTIEYDAGLGFELTWETDEARHEQVLEIVSDDAFLVTRSVPWLEWVHVAAVYDGSSLALHLNGKLENRRPVGPRSASPFPAYFGRRVDADCCFLDGLIDDLRIYNRPLSAGEIAALASH